MKTPSEQRFRQDLLQAFKKTTARFNQPLPGSVNLLDAFEGLLRELQPDLPLIDFSPFTLVEAPVEKQSEPLLEVVPTDRRPVSRGRGNRDSASQFRAVSAPNRSPEFPRHTRDNGSPESLKHVAAVPVFKVAPDPRHLSGDMHINTPSGQTGTREQARPLPRRIRESGAGEKPVHVASHARPSSAANDLQQKDSRTGPDLPDRQDRPQVAGESSLASALEIVGRLADELLAGPLEAGICNPVSPDKGRTAKQRTDAAQQTPPAEIKQFATESATESPALVRRGTVGTSPGQSGQTRSDALPANNFEPGMNTGAAALTISRIDALTDRLLVDNRYPEQHGRRPLQRSSLSAGDVSDPPPVRRAAARIGADKQILQRPVSASTENAAPNGPSDGLRHLNQPRCDPAGAIEPALTAEQLAEFINDVLVDQARRHGVDLS